MRTGFHRSEEFPKLLNAIKSAPLRHLTIHGRTRPQRYTGAADWTKVHEATVNCPFPVIGSGDVCDIGTLKTRQACSPHIKAVIIGRGALRNPWVFTTASNAPVLASLAAFILLQDLALESHERLVSWCAELNSDAFGIDDEDGWQRLIENLMSDLRSKNIKTLADIEVTSRALSRGKMLWNYLRSSLPVAFMEPSLMRAQTLAGFLGQINEIARQLHISPANLPVVYNSEHDWMYSGAGRGPKP
jgi:tRNA-dihydrouridine synthase